MQWSMAMPFIALEFALILVAGICLNLVTVSFASRLRPRRDPMGPSDTVDSDDWDDLLRAAEALSAQYDAIADSNHRRAAAMTRLCGSRLRWRFTTLPTSTPKHRTNRMAETIRASRKSS